jgi:Flp pilus assembly pilin Flp
MNEVANNKWANASRVITKLRFDDRGAATAEYAIATMAAVGFAGLLVVIMRSDEIKAILFDLVKSALTFTNPNDAAPTN